MSCLYFRATLFQVENIVSSGYFINQKRQTYEKTTEKD